MPQRCFGTGNHATIRWSSFRRRWHAESGTKQILPYCPGRPNRARNRAICPAVLEVGMEHDTFPVNGAIADQSSSREGEPSRFNPELEERHVMENRSRAYCNSSMRLRSQALGGQAPPSLSRKCSSRAPLVKPRSPVLLQLDSYFRGCIGHIG